MNDKNASEKPSLRDLLIKVCKLQPFFSRENTDQMQLRGTLIRDEIKIVLSLLIGSARNLQVQGKDGTGGKTRIPWIRVYNEHFSPKPTQGYYLVYLFSADGQSVVLSLNQGTTNSVEGNFHAKPEHEVRERRDKARSIIGPQIDQQVETSFALSDDGPLAQGYIAGNIYSKTYQLDRFPDDSTLSADLSTFISWLSTLYERHNHVEAMKFNPEDRNVLVVYVSSKSITNLEHGLAEGIWGFREKSTPENFNKLKPGDTIVLARGYSGGSPRIALEKWLQNSLQTMYVASITSSTFYDESPEWPDETNLAAKDRYVQRIRFDTNSVIMFENTVMKAYSGGYDQFFDSIRMSGITQGKGYILPINQFPLAADVDSQKPTFNEIAIEFGLHLSDCHLEFTPTVVTRLLSSLLSKRFLILTGLSGSGKTKLAVALAQWLTPNCYQVIPVGADWTGNENVIGYPDGLNHQQFNTTPILDLVLEAIENPKQPYVLILDEMNLSHVERYFSDILSCIESDESLTLYSGTLTERSTWRKSLSGASIPPQLAAFPPNLFIIGTVNIDETTYMFSPKVLDRAHVIEFRVSNAQIKQFLDNPQKPNMSLLRGKGTKYGQSFVARSQSAIECSQTLQQTLQSELLTFFKCLSTVGAEFGFRTALEMVRFVSFYIELNESTLTTITQSIDFVVLQKLLPKLHGSRTKLAPVLKQLWYLCITPIDKRELNYDDGTMLHSSQSSLQADPSSAVPANAPYPASAEKIARMWKLLHANGFTSFAEA